MPSSCGICTGIMEGAATYTSVEDQDGISKMIFSAALFGEAKGVAETSEVHSQGWEGIGMRGRDMISS